jgi:uncharacterized protein with PIN domain
VSQPTTENHCPDCNGALEEIKLFGRSWKNPINGAAVDSEVIYYADAKARRSSFLSMYEEAGTVRTTMCPECHRIFLHAVPKLG